MEINGLTSNIANWPVNLITYAVNTKAGTARKEDSGATTQSTSCATNKALSILSQ